MLRFVRARVEFRQHIRTDTLHLRRIVRAIPRPFVQRARVRTSVCNKVSSPRLVVMQANHLMAKRTFRIERVKPPSTQQFYNFDQPYGQTHDSFTSGSRPQLERNCVPVLWPLMRNEWKKFTPVPTSVNNKIAELIALSCPSARRRAARQLVREKLLNIGSPMPMLAAADQLRVPT
jgi:hypothetical protein